MEAARIELEEREKVRDELQGIRVWLEAADSLLSEMEQSGSTQELQVRHSSKLVFIRDQSHFLWVFFAPILRENVFASLLQKFSG